MDFSNLDIWICHCSNNADMNFGAMAKSFGGDNITVTPPDLSYYGKIEGPEKLEETWRFGLMFQRSN